jgi:small subunit ribosomal protein S9
MTKNLEEYVASGRRKTSVASVRLRRGSGNVNVNGKPFESHFPLEVQRERVLRALKEVEGIGKYDLLIRVKGGGIEGQVDATSLGLARALVKEDEVCRGGLKSLGLLTRDPRMKERKKYGQPGARKRFQFSKR